MESILSIIAYLSIVLIAGASMYGIKNFASLNKMKNSKNEITKLQAKVATLRMALKARLKVKVISFRSQFTSKANKGDGIDLAIDALAAIRFENADEFQKYFDISKKINSLIEAELNPSDKKTKEEEKTLEDFMGPNLKNEIAIIRILKEITDSSEKLNKRIDHFNLQNKDNKKFVPLKKVENLDFPALIEIKRVFRKCEKMIKEMQAEDPDLFENAA